jgi:hypothetical protein
LSKVVWPAVVTSPPWVTGDIAFSNQHNCRPLRRKEKEKTETKLTQLLRPPACLPAAATAVEYATVFLSLDAQSSSTSRDICTAHMVHYSLSSSKRVGKKKTPAKNGATGLAKKKKRRRICYSTKDYKSMEEAEAPQILLPCQRDKREQLARSKQATFAGHHSAGWSFARRIASPQSFGTDLLRPARPPEQSTREAVKSLGGELSRNPR